MYLCVYSVVMRVVFNFLMIDCKSPKVKDTHKVPTSYLPHFSLHFLLAISHGQSEMRKREKGDEIDDVGYACEVFDDLYN